MNRLKIMSVMFLVMPFLDSAADAQPLDYWTGFYAGLNVGYGWSGQAVEVSGIGPGTPSSTLADDPSGVIGGAQVGYNHRIGWIVLGAEADFQGASISATQAVSTTRTLLSSTGILTLQSRTTAEQDLNFLGTLRGRIGVVPWNPLLLYGTGGFAYGHVSLSGTLVEARRLMQGMGGITSEDALAGSRSGVETGWTVGGGAEYRFAERWSVKAEYLHYDLGTASASLAISRPTFSGTSFPRTLSTDFKGNIVRVGVNFRF